MRLGRGVGHEPRRRSPLRNPRARCWSNADRAVVAGIPRMLPGPGCRRQHHGGGPRTSCLEEDRGNLAAVWRHASLTPAARLGLGMHCAARDDYHRSAYCYLGRLAPERTPETAMRIESSVTSLSWIPQGATEGFNRPTFTLLASPTRSATSQGAGGPGRA